MGGLIGKLGLFPFMKRLNHYDLNDVSLESGIYGLNFSFENAPSNESSQVGTGMIIIFNGKGLSFGGDPILQIAVNYIGEVIRFRTNWVGIWYDWKTISLT